MNCVELQESLLEAEDAHRPEQRTHLRSCAACSALVADLLTIVATAPQLRAAAEPAPRVWHSIAATLREEGIIHPPRMEPGFISSFSARWGRAAWLVPLAAMLLISAGIYVRSHSGIPAQSSQQIFPKQKAEVVAGLNDDDFLQEVADTTPGMKAQWEDNLRAANDYIRDAQSEVDSNPNDEEARQTLLDAYQQKAMLFEMAMDRSLP